MRAIVVQSLGSPDVLELAEAPRPEPGPGQVLVRLQAAGVSFSDTERRRGVYRRPDLPWIPGSEGAGVVEGFGPGVDPGLEGERVAFWAMPPAVSGTYAEFAVAPAESLFRLGSGVGFETGAALPLQGLTAYGVVHLAARVEAGQTVLIHAAAGGVGLLAVQLALPSRSTSTTSPNAGRWSGEICCAGSRRARSASRCPPSSRWRPRPRRTG